MDERKVRHRIRRVQQKDHPPHNIIIGSTTNDQAPGSPELVVVAYTPDLRCFDFLLDTWYSSNVRCHEVQWKRAPQFDQFKQHCYSALRQYMHLCHRDYYNANQYATDSRGKIGAIRLEVPRFVRDMLREVTRPMLLHGVILVPYLALSKRGIDPAPGLGIKAANYLMLPAYLRQHFPECDLVTIEAEQPLIVPVSMDTSECVMHSPGVPDWRQRAFEGLRHFNASGKFIWRATGRCHNADNTPLPLRTYAAGDILAAVGAAPLPLDCIAHAHPIRELNVASDGFNVVETDLEESYMIYHVAEDWGQRAVYAGVASMAQRNTVEEACTRLGRLGLRLVLTLRGVHNLTPQVLLQDRGYVASLGFVPKIVMRLPSSLFDPPTQDRFPTNAPGQHSATPPPKGRESRPRQGKRAGRTEERLQKIDTPTVVEAFSRPLPTKPGGRRLSRPK
jgi:hypothetical protein